MKDTLRTMHSMVWAWLIRRNWYINFRTKTLVMRSLPPKYMVEGVNVKIDYTYKEGWNGRKLKER